MLNPFKPVWQVDPTLDNGGTWACSVDPADWVETNHPDAEQAIGIHPRAGGGHVWEWDGGYLFCAPHGYIELGTSLDADSPSEALDLNTLWNHRLDDFGDWVPSDTEPVAITVSSAPNEERCIHFSDGTTITDSVSATSLVRSQMGDEGISSWPVRISTEGVEMSEHAITYLYDRLAERDTTSSPWRWCVPAHEVDDARDFIEQTVGVRLP